MIVDIQPQGLFIPECGIAGETRKDGAWPAMADALQLSKDRWLILYSTRGFLGVDDGFRGSDNDRSIAYQVRKEGPLGPILKEDILACYREDWDVLGDGRRNHEQHCHSGGFGVPKGALINGKRVPHENVFVASWYRSPRARGNGLADLPTQEYERQIYEAAYSTEWVQFQLRDDGNDIELLQPRQQMRQKGFESGRAFCSIEPLCPMNKWYVKPAPFSDDLSEWAQVPHFRDGIAAIRLKFNPATGLYEWVQTGPMFVTSGNDESPSRKRVAQLTETSLLRFRDSWIILTRGAERLSKGVRGAAWLRTHDLFKPLPRPIFPATPFSKSPCAAFRCPDGTIRLFTNDMTISPYKDDRNPLYGWDVDPDRGFEATNCRVAFDAVKAGLPVRDESWPRVDMPNLFTHAGGREQVITYRVRLRQRRSPHTRLVDEEKQRTGLYHGRIVYDHEYPPQWSF